MTPAEIRALGQRLGAVMDQLNVRIAEAENALHGLGLGIRASVVLEKDGHSAVEDLAAARAEIADWKLAASMEPQRATEVRGLALEEAARLLEGRHQPNCYDRPQPEGTTTAQFGCSQCSRAKDLRALSTLDSTMVVLPREDVAKVREAGIKISMLLTDARITKGGLCSGEFAKEAQAEFGSALALLEAK